MRKHMCKYRTDLEVKVAQVMGQFELISQLRVESDQRLQKFTKLRTDFDAYREASVTTIQALRNTLRKTGDELIETRRQREEALLQTPDGKIQQGAELAADRDWHAYQDRK